VRTSVPTALLVAGLGLLTACGDGTSSASSSSTRETDAAAKTSQSGTPGTVGCPGRTTAVQLPAGFAAPLPSGTVVVAVQKRTDGTTVVTGVVPTAEADVLKELQRSYSSGGWKLTRGETEKRDAESDFTGSGIQGRWGIRDLSDCSPAATRIDLVVRAG
jgi:hypothetical protein